MKKGMMFVWKWAAFGLFAFSLAAPAPGFSEPAKPSFSGQATGVRATVLNLPSIVLSDTGPLPESGGAQEATLLEATIPSGATGGILTLSAEALHASTVGQGDRSRSEASIANLDTTISGNGVAADFLMARAEAVCTAAGPVLSGASELANLVINGIPIVVTGTANQRIDLPNGYVIINEQTSSTNGNDGEITVNALHVVTFNPVTGGKLADVVVASAHADIRCQGQPDCQNAKDFVTGGGWIVAPSGEKGTFAVGGGIKNGAFWGHLTYIDHGARLRVKGTAVTGYEILGPTTRRIRGTAEINGQAGTYEVTVSDNGEPGRNDEFTLQLSTGYMATGKLIGGNIQLHRPDCNETPPAS